MQARRKKGNQKTGKENVTLNEKNIQLKKKVKKIGAIKRVTEFIFGIKKSISKNGDNKSRGKIGSTAKSIMLSYGVMVALIIMLGVVSYEKASNGMITGYEQASLQNITTTSEYINLAMDTVKNELRKYSLNLDLNNYVSGNMSDVSTTLTFLTDIKKSITSSLSNNKFISNVYIIPGKKYNDLSSATNSNKGFFEGLINSTETQGLVSGNAKWSGTHTLIDKELGIKSSGYIVSYMQMIGDYSSKNTLLAVDVDASEIADIIRNITNEGTITGFITNDKRELTVIDKDKNNIKNNLFLDANYLNDNLEESGSRYVKYNGSEYLYIYSKVGDTGVTICQLIPKIIIMKQAFEIRQIIFVIVIIAVLLSIIMAGRISNIINRCINNTNKNSLRVSEGDLTGKIEVNGNGDFAQLAHSINGMTQSVRIMTISLNDVSDEVYSSALSIDEIYGKLLDSNDNIAVAIEDIAKDNGQQVVVMQSCLMKVGEMSDTILEIHSQLSNTQKLANGTKSSMSQTSQSVYELKEITSDVTNVVKNVADEMNALNLDSMEIRKMVVGISEISDRTNLLSLNARIEAGRAGASGVGFSVISQEIHELSNTTNKFAHEIGKIANRIEEHTTNLESTMKKTYQSELKQESIVEEVLEVFLTMQKNMDDLFAGIYEVSNQVETIDEIRKDTLESVERTTIVSEEIMASSEYVTASMDVQVEFVGNLNKVVKSLRDNTNKLNLMISKYKV